MNARRPRVVLGTLAFILVVVGVGIAVAVGLRLLNIWSCAGFGHC